jgi:hypothetical protein
MTKTYNYIYNGVPGSVNVTTTITQCEIGEASGSTGLQTGVLSIITTLSAALPFQLQVRFLVDYTDLTAFGSNTINDQPVLLAMPANTTNHTFTNVQCFKRMQTPFREETWVYEFADQAQTQDVGSALTATVGQVVNVSCFGLPNGSISINATGGSGGYVFTWGDIGVGTSIRSSLPAGTYSVTVKDSSNAEVVINNIVVTQPTQIVANQTVNNVTCFGAANGSIQLAPSGGTAPYTFSWSDGSTVQNRTGLSSGNYSVTITDSAGCTRLVTMTLSQPSQINITTQKEGRNVVNTITGGTSPYTYLWSDGVVTKDRTNIPDGTYSFTVTDANGCNQSTTILIETFKFFFSKNPIWLELQAQDISTKPNLSFVCEVYLEEQYESGNFVLKYASEQPARVDGGTDFNVQQVLNAFLDSAVPAFGDDQVRLVGEGFKRFYLKYFEKFGTPPTAGPATTQDTYYVLFGGISEQEFAKNTFFETYLDEEKPFLTWTPAVQVIGSNQDSYLHFVVNNQQYTSLTLKATVRYEDLTSISQNVKSFASSKPYELLRFPAGVKQLGLDVLNPAKKIKEYDLQLFSGTVELSQKKTYQVYPERRYYKKLIYRNSLGAWDHVLCLGRGKKSLSTKEESINRELGVGYGYSDREEETVSKVGELTGEFVIANLNGYQRAHLIDLAISERVYEQTASGYLAVGVKMNLDPEDDFENLEEIGLEIMYPLIRRYTPEL